jgi:iron uptake system EfeUOB component EfeO/EfeM
MIKLRSFAAVTALVTVLTLTGCASKNADQKTTQVKEQPKVEEAQKTLTISQGTQNMREALKNMKEMLAAKNEEVAIKESSKLEENWKPIEDSLKDKNKDLYEKVETPLGVINTAIKVKPLDTKTLSSAIDSLDNTLSEVQKLK